MPIARPPRHRADAKAVYIWNRDKAWIDIKPEELEIERLNAERKQAAEEAKADSYERIDWDAHPVRQYRLGTTRFSLDAAVPWRGELKCAADYLDESKGQAIRFHLRRLSWDEWYEVTALTDYRRMTSRACQLGLVSVEGDPGLAVDPDRRMRSHEEMQTLFDVSEELIIRIGEAVLASSKPLDDGEKKP